MSSAANLKRIGGRGMRWQSGKEIKLGDRQYHMIFSMEMITTGDKLAEKSSVIN